MIRHAVPNDVPAIRKIAERAYAVYVGRLGKKPAPMIADFEAHIGRDWTIVFENKAVQGYAILLERDSSHLLDNIAVDTSAQRQGIGRALIDYIEKFLIEANQEFYDLYTNIVMTENVLWYQKLGFVELKRVEEKGFKRIYMRKDLTTKG